MWKKPIFLVIFFSLKFGFLSESQIKKLPCILVLRYLTLHNLAPPIWHFTIWHSMKKAILQIYVIHDRPNPHDIFSLKCLSLPNWSFYLYFLCTYVVAFWGCCLLGMLPFRDVAFWGCCLLGMLPFRDVAFWLLP